MAELNLCHLVREHPLISFLFCAAPVVFLTFFTMNRILIYREKRCDGTGVNALSVHTVLSEGAQYEDALARVYEYCPDNFKTLHVTVQVEPLDFAEHETHL